MSFKKKIAMVSLLITAVSGKWRRVFSAAVEEAGWLKQWLVL